MKHFEFDLFLSVKKKLYIDKQKVIIQMLISYVFIFRQKKLEKVMEEEGLKDEEVINIGKFP